jgi:glyoxalase family protein
MPTTVHGIHHVTVIADDAQQNLDFYVAVMGMRLVKKSVNQDAPNIYHLYYADRLGTPGTNLTFFPWKGISPTRGKLGIGLTVEIPFVIPKGSMDYWQERLGKTGVAVGELETRFGELTLPFRDHDGVCLALVETSDARPFVAWERSTVPEEHQLRGVHSVRLWERDLAPTAMLLTEHLGFTHVGEEDGWHRYAVEGGGAGKFIDIKELPTEHRGVVGAGTTHHVAWRMYNDTEELTLQQTVADLGLKPTKQIDRFWFRSVYFKEPGGVLFELATDDPGFDRDEDRGHLGEKLILPPWLEPYRKDIEAELPSLTMPRYRE